MTLEEALNAIIDAIPDPENYDEHFGVLRDMISGVDASGVDVETENEWKKKYEDLREKYRGRFKENIFGGESGPDSPKGLDAIEENMNQETQIADLRDLDFDGRSE